MLGWNGSISLGIGGVVEAVPNGWSRWQQPEMRARSEDLDPVDGEGILWMVEGSCGCEMRMGSEDFDPVDGGGILWMVKGSCGC